MKSSNISSFLLVALLVSLSACLTDETTIEYLQDPKPEDEEIADDPVQRDTSQIIIVDQTGKEWEIGHAVRNYGFEPDEFQFGLGPNAIRPILEPQMIEPGEPGYPDRNSSFLILGTRLEEDARAYPLPVMAVHEIVDEDFDDLYVAVAY